MLLYLFELFADLTGGLLEWIDDCVDFCLVYFGGKDCPLWLHDFRGEDLLLLYLFGFIDYLGGIFG